jgi:hypothetical protein
VELSLLPREEPVTIDGKKYTLREISEGDSIVERREMAKGVSLNSDGKPTAIPENLSENEAFVVSRCLFDESNTPVSINTIKTWPRRVVRALFDRCQELNKEPTREQVKN